MSSLTRVQPDHAPQGMRIAPMHVFENIEVVPATTLHHLGQIADGGPLWPDFDTQSAVRHWRDGGPVDQRTLPDPDAHEALDTPCVWGGFASPHFGHFVAEYAPRLPLSIRERPDDTYLFTLPPLANAQSVPAFFHRITRWYGLRAGQVRFVDRPLRAARLRVAPQGEYLEQGGPGTAFLEALEDIASRNNLVPEEHDILYVGRLASLSHGKGAHAGERYLVDVLRRLGITVLDPEAEALERQLALYAGAKHIVFSEGSAIHGRQLLGRVEQEITILVRRPGSRIAQAMLTPRCTKVTYAAVVQHWVPPRRRNGDNWRPRGIAFFDKPALFATFRRLGVDLSSLWDDAAFYAAQRADAAAWVSWLGNRRDIDFIRTCARAGPVFHDLGLGHLCQELQRTIAGNGGNHPHRLADQKEH